LIYFLEVNKIRKGTSSLSLGYIAGASCRIESDFYETSYLEKNPTLDVKDCKWKYNQIRDLLDFDYKIEKVLEVGCGSGVLLEMVREHLDSNLSIGCDISKEILKKSRMLAGANSYIRADAEYLPFKDSSVDPVYFFDLLEHVQSPGEVLRELKRVSNDILIAIPIESGYISDLMYMAMRILGRETNLERYGHIHRFTRGRCLSLLEKSSIGIRRYSVVKSKFSEYTSLSGRIFLTISRATYSISKRMHERLFGGYVFIALCGTKTT
jgi:SAM-dependent methyltransferase